MKQEKIYGIQCLVNSIKCGDGKQRNAYRFTVPGWPECEIIGKDAAKRVINARLSPGVGFLYGLDDRRRTKPSLNEQINSAASRSSIQSDCKTNTKRTEKAR